jgi:hypothetical protein
VLLLLLLLLLVMMNDDDYPSLTYEGRCQGNKGSFSHTHQHAACNQDPVVGCHTAANNCNQQRMDRRQHRKVGNATVIAADICLHVTYTNSAQVRGSGVSADVTNVNVAAC